MATEPKAGPMIECDNLVKIYKTEDIEVMALQGLDARVERGELVAIIGNSGSGKSTFLNMIGGLDRPSAGRLFVDGKDLFKLTEPELVEYKRTTVGFVWQNNARNLIPYLPAWQNVQMPMLFEGKDSGRDKRERAYSLLELVGMGHRADRRLRELSGGEQQRVAIAIALANSPKVLLADEPTGSVDPETAQYIFEAFRRLNREMGQTIVIVTHDMSVASQVSRVMTIRDGKISAEHVLRDDYRERLMEASLSHHLSHDEFAVLDRSGRVQLPPELLSSAGITGKRVKMTVQEGQIVISSPTES